MPDREDHLIASLAALAVAIHLLEAALPSPLPGVKPGLANVVTLVVLLRYGLPVALWVGLLRVLAGSLFLGTFMTPTFFLSASGAIAALAMLWLSWRLAGPRIGPIGLGTLAALAHMAAQFAAAYLLFVPHPGMLRLLPVLLTAALIFGITGGIIADRVLERVGQRGDPTVI